MYQTNVLSISLTKFRMPVTLSISGIMKGSRGEAGMVFGLLEPQSISLLITVQPLLAIISVYLLL